MVVEHWEQLPKRKRKVIILNMAMLRDILSFPYPSLQTGFLTFNSVHPEIFHWSHCFLFTSSMDAGNSVDVRYALGRKQLTDYNKIVHRNTEFSIPYEIVFFFIVSARKHKNRLPQYSHPTAEEHHLLYCSKDHNICSPSYTLKGFLGMSHSAWCQLIIQISGFLQFCSVPEEPTLLLASNSPYPEICLTQGQRFGKNKSLAEYVHGDNG